MRLSILLVLLGATPVAAVPSLFNVRDYASIQKAVDACAAAGGGTVYFPPGEYTSGTIRLRSHVRLYLEAGAVLRASRNPADFFQGEKRDRTALIYAEDAENIGIEGRGTLDGQAEYEWHLDDLDDAFIRENTLIMKAAGRPLMRPFPRNYRTDPQPKMILLLRCKDVRIAGVSMVRSRSWTIHPYACERLVVDGVYIQSSLKEGVWADGIDPDGCKDVRIANSTIETGDDAIVFYSMNWFGPALPCENITVTNCRLSSASSAIKFCDGNMNCVRRVAVDNTVITNSNRGLAFMVFDGGYVSDVVMTNLTIECVRYGWYWWGDGDPIHFNIKRRSEVHPQVSKTGEPPAGSIRNVLIRNVVARGKGTCGINGHPDSWLDGISIENVKLFLSAEPGSPVEKAVHAVKLRWARNIRLKDLEIFWDKPESPRWESALWAEDAEGLVLDGFGARQARPGADTPAVVLRQVNGAVLRNCYALPGAGVFLRVEGAGSRRIRLFGNDLSEARRAFVTSPGVSAGAIVPSR
jgi:polygalacturonase